VDTYVLLLRSCFVSRITWSSLQIALEGSHHLGKLRMNALTCGDTDHGEDLARSSAAWAWGSVPFPTQSMTIELVALQVWRRPIG
jgi:hypothetical protein